MNRTLTRAKFLKVKEENLFINLVSMKLAVLFISHNQIRDVKIGMQIVRKVWSKNPLLKNIEIYHAYNGKKEFYPQKYLEKVLSYIDQILLSLIPLNILFSTW